MCRTRIPPTPWTLHPLNATFSTTLQMLVAWTSKLAALLYLHKEDLSQLLATHALLQSYKQQTDGQASAVPQLQHFFVLVDNSPTQGCTELRFVSSVMQGAPQRLAMQTCAPPTHIAPSPSTTPCPLQPSLWLTCRQHLCSHLCDHMCKPLL